VLVTANPDGHLNELRYAVEHSGACGIFFVPEHRGNLIGASAATIACDSPVVRRIFDLAALLELVAPLDRAPHPASPQPGDGVQIQYTSGMTGRPKGTLMSHRALTNNSRIIMGRHRPDPGERLLRYMPLFQTGGCGFLLLGAVQHGMHILLLGRFDANTVARVVERDRVGVMLAVPTMLVGILEAQDRAARELSSLRLVMTGAALVSPELVRRVRGRMECAVAVLYVQTETVGTSPRRGRPTPTKTSPAPSGGPCPTPSFRSGTR
jgi:acyl-CoA synthetase (AMP-forming)/AMP-acid ligase II